MSNRKLKARIIEQFGSQTDFARLLGLSEDRLSKIIHGRITPNDAERQQISRRLGVKQVELFPQN